MSSDRITPEQVEGAGSGGEYPAPWNQYRAIHADWMRRLAAQMREDAARLERAERAERERDDFADRLTVCQEESAGLRADPALRALVEECERSAMVRPAIFGSVRSDAARVALVRYVEGRAAELTEVYAAPCTERLDNVGNEENSR